MLILLVSNGAPERIRTSDLCLRRATLYPAELRAHYETQKFTRFVNITNQILTDLAELSQPQFVMGVSLKTAPLSKINLGEGECLV